MDDSLPLFFHDGPLNEKGPVQLSEDTARHATGVLRMGTGERLRLTDGKGTEALCTLSLVSKKNVSVAITDIRRHQPPSGGLHLAIAFTKNTSRNEWLLEKAAELGVRLITPLITARGNRERVRKDRAEGILQSAMLQSMQFFKTVLGEPTPLALLLGQKTESRVFLAHCLADRQRSAIRTLTPSPGEQTLLLIGPEGDFSREEVEQAALAGAVEIALGSTRLRTETAAIAACSYFHLQNEG